MPNYSAKPSGERDGIDRKGDAASEGRVTLMEAALMYTGNEVPVFPVWNLEENGCCECPNGPFCQNAGNHPIGPLVPHGLTPA